MKRYPSATDGWLYWMVQVAAFGCVVLAGMLFVRLESLVASFAWGGLCLTLSVFLYWILNATWYGLGRDGLHIQSGPMKLFIRYADIRGVAPTTSLLASPALSLKRLYIAYEGSALGVRISPVDPEAFVADLVQYCPHLVRNGYVLEPK